VTFPQKSNRKKSTAMNALLAPRLRAATLAAALLSLPALAATAPAADRAAELLRTHGRIAVESAGPHVQVGTYRIQVSVKLGSASEVLPDGTWLYKNYVADDSAAHGTLLVRFTHGRVSDLTLAGPAAVAALRESQAGGKAQQLIASQQR
jgi:hypothetical protein